MKELWLVSVNFLISKTEQNKTKQNKTKSRNKYQ